MEQQTRRYRTLFLVLTVLAALVVSIEGMLHVFGASLCVSAGCRTTAQYARFGDGSILLAGFLLFSGLAVLSLASRKGRSAQRERLINVVLIAALAGEGFFMGYLAFQIHTFCLFCVTLFSFLAIAAIVRVLAGEREVLAGFAAFLAVFGLHYAILPAAVPIHLPADPRLILFYSRDCSHCTEVMQELDRRRIPVAHLPVQDYAAFLRNMAIDHVPTLMVNDPLQKIFLTGREAILQYLAASSVPKKTARKKGDRRQSAADHPAAAPVTARPDILNPPGLSLTPLQPGDEGMCREDAACK